MSIQRSFSLNHGCPNNGFEGMFSTMKSTMWKSGLFANFIGNDIWKLDGSILSPIGNNSTYTGLRYLERLPSVTKSIDSTLASEPESTMASNVSSLPGNENSTLALHMDAFSVSESNSWHQVFGLTLH